jgi:hypothetical protein
MMTVAVAAREAGASRYYRGLLADAKFDAIFTPEIEFLIRCVKSRPVDLVLFDLTTPSIPPTSWLEAVKQDGDLALTPVLWVGSTRPLALATTLDNYRPGMRVIQRPNLTTFMELVEKIVGRTPGREPSEPNDASLTSKEWKPEVETIDDALSIFADSGSKNGREHAKPFDGHEPENERDFQSAEIRRPAPVNHTRFGHGNPSVSTTSEVLAIPPSGPAERSVIDFSAGSSHEPTRRSPSSELESSPASVANESVAFAEAPLSDEFIDEVTSRVISRLAVEVFRNLNAGAVRQAVKEVLAERGE